MACRKAGGWKSAVSAAYCAVSSRAGPGGGGGGPGAGGAGASAGGAGDEAGVPELCPPSLLLLLLPSPLLLLLLLLLAVVPVRLGPLMTRRLSRGTGGAPARDGARSAAVCVGRRRVSTAHKGCETHTASGIRPNHLV